MRVLVAGMGSAIGTNIALRLAEDPAVEALCGFDLEPPRRWIPSAEFHYAVPGDAARVHEIVNAFEPEVVVHAWVFEPRARSSPGQARGRTMAGTEALLGACSRVDSVQRFVVRSTASIYGARRRGASATIDTAPRPTSTFGDIVARVEDRVAEVAQGLGASMVAARVAPVMASNLPNPLGRYMSLPVVPIPVTTRRFGVLHLGDAVRVIAASATSTIEGPINVIAPGRVTPMQAITIGRRVPVPLAPTAFSFARRLAEIPGTPLPEHVAETLTNGMRVTGCDTGARLGLAIRRTTTEAIADLYSAGRLIEVDVDRLVGTR
ncbi:MAG: NAD-dependent epimerase/dehydratase family protein [Actinomycetota bacterium]